MILKRTGSVASQEFEISYSDLMTLSSHAALTNFYARHDRRIEQITAGTNQPKACTKGCSYCCHFKVIADAVEIFSMVEYIKSELDLQQIEEIIESAKQNMEQAKALNHEEQATINQKCPLLIDNVCLVYPARSIKCRNFHATDTNNCRASYENPKDLTILNNNIPDLYIAATGSSDGFMAALHAQGYDDRIYDLGSALIEALENTDCKRRYDAGKRAFTKARYNN
ncbi:MAG: hypothetical protein ACN4GM_07645 [Gammaproteobacteria bacterium]